MYVRLLFTGTRTVVSFRRCNNYKKWVEIGFFTDVFCRFQILARHIIKYFLLPKLDYSMIKICFERWRAPLLQLLRRMEEVSKFVKELISAPTANYLLKVWFEWSHHLWIQSQAIRFGNFKLIHNAALSTFELYDLDVDLDESNDLLDEGGVDYDLMRTMLSKLIEVELWLLRSLDIFKISL